MTDNAIIPFCPHFTVCGGCSFQHIAYEEHAALKEKFVLELFAELCDGSTKIAPLLSCIPSRPYRNKMEFSFKEDASGNRYLGLYQKQGRQKVTNIETCGLCAPWFSAVLGCVRRWWEQSTLRAYHPYKNTGCLRTVTLREGIRTGQKLVMLTVSGNSTPAITQGQIQQFIKALKDCVDEKALSIVLQVQTCIKGSPTKFEEIVLHGSPYILEQLHLFGRTYSFKVSATSFFQPNTRQAEALYAAALSAVSLPQNAVVLDLYCGTGALGIAASSRAARVIGIEKHSESVRNAKENLALNGIDNVEIHEGDVKEVLARLFPKEHALQPDLVIVDPPRAGLEAEALELISALQPKQILYISCNPVTQQKNVAALRDKGYALKFLQSVDQFPYTTHIEHITLLCG